MQTTADFKKLFLSDTPLMDVRAPIEFEKGAFPHTVNLPLMTNDEREAVGTCYKNSGQDAAIKLGHELVNGGTKKSRVNQWAKFIEQNPKGLLYCFRGGLRSRVTQQWIEESGQTIQFIEGGYKAMRTFLLDNLQQRIKEGRATILSGATGSGKTEVIQDWHNSIDLEGLANHRGSAFGNTGTDQPSQIDFENAWSIEWLKKHEAGLGPVLFEDESRLIGRIAVVPEFLELSKQAPIILLTASLEDRIERIRRDYFQNAYQQKIHLGEQSALKHLDDFIRQALTRIQKRLGGERFLALTSFLDQGIKELQSQNNWQAFDDIVNSLLTDYYDPMYQYQFQKKEPKQVFKGTHQEILEWLSQQPVA